MREHTSRKKVLIAASLAATTAPLLWVAFKYSLCPDGTLCDLFFSVYTFIAATAVSCIGFYYYLKFNQYSIKDLATGTYTKNYFFDVTAQEIIKSQRYDAPLTVMIFSLGKHKEGMRPPDSGATMHAVCDKVSSSIRESDVLSHLDNERFAILLPHTPVDGARTLAYRLSNAIAKVYAQQGIHGLMEAPFGLSDYKKDTRNSPHILFEAASAAHRAARESVRNKVIAYGDPGMAMS